MPPKHRFNEVTLLPPLNFEAEAIDDKFEFVCVFAFALSLACLTRSVVVVKRFFQRLAQIGPS